MTDQEEDATETSPLLSNGHCRTSSPHPSTPATCAAAHSRSNGHTHSLPLYRSTNVGIRAGTGGDVGSTTTTELGSDKLAAAVSPGGGDDGDETSTPSVTDEEDEERNSAIAEQSMPALSPPFSYRFRRGRDGRAMVAAGFPESSPLSRRAYFPNDGGCRGRRSPRVAKDRSLHDSSGGADEEEEFVVANSGGSLGVVSVCVPCFDEGASSLRRTLDSLRSQRGLMGTEVEPRRSQSPSCGRCLCPNSASTFPSPPRSQRREEPRMYRLDVVVIVDGADQMSDSMRRYLAGLFGVYTPSSSTEGGRDEENGSGCDPLPPVTVKDPFDELDQSVETIVVYPDPDDENDDGWDGDGGIVADEHDDGAPSSAAAFNVDRAGKSATPTWKPTTDCHPCRDRGLNLTLVIKRRNRRKINSHAWWLGAHGRDVTCRYALATDCGTVFHPNAVRRLVDRLEDDSNLSAVTGFKRAMTSTVQGDGPWHVEWRRDPLGAMLREVQRYNFEYDQACSAKPAYDTIGFLPVLSGPCFLCRYEDVGDLERGMLRSYVELADQPTDDIVLGNLQLAEDRMPPMLLVFGTGNNGEELDDDEIVRPGRKTGLVHDAVYYFENEKPLSQLVKQRRRWSNGTVAAYIWFLREGRWRRNRGTVRQQQPWMRRLPAAALIAIDLYQAMVGRLFGPGLIAVMTFMVGLFGFDAMVQTEIMLEHYEVGARYRDPSHLVRAFASGGLYLFLYATFVGFHTPRAIQKGSRWKLDQESAFHPDLFILGLVANAILMMFFWMCPLITCLRLGWDDTPVPLKGLLLANLSPFIFVVLSGMIHSQHPNVQGLLGLFRSAPIFLLASFWFSVWFPAYATARVSDLTWGNRNVDLDDDGNVAIRKRAEFGIRVSLTLVCSNTAVFVVSTFLIYRAPTVAATAAMFLCLAPAFSYAVVIADFAKRFFDRMGTFVCKCPCRCCQP